MKATNPVMSQTPFKTSTFAEANTPVKARTPVISRKPAKDTGTVRSGTMGGFSTDAKGTTSSKPSTSPKSPTVVKRKSKAAQKSAIRSAVLVVQDHADEEGARADENTTVPEIAAKDKHRAVERHGLRKGYAHAEKKRRHRPKKVVIESDSACDDKDPMQIVADRSVDKGRTNDFRPSDAGPERIDSGVDHDSSIARAAESVKKQSTFSVRRV